MKSKRKNKSYLCPILDAILKDKLYHARPNQAPWYTSEELNQILIKHNIIHSSVGNQRIGAYLTAAGFVRKDFYVLRKNIGVDGRETDYNSRKIKKWRVGLVNIATM